MNLRAFMPALLGSILLVAPAIAAAQSVYMGPDGREGGVISNVQGSSFQLANGVTIFMHQGTIINPTGTTLQPGQTVMIYGSDNGDGTINANAVVLRAPGTDIPRDGFYDVNGVFHSAPATGWYEQNGMLHERAAGGWYDVNGNFHAGSPNGYFLGPDGLWHLR